MAEEKILVADDELQYVEVIGFKFRNAGYQVVTAPDGEEALAVARVEQPQLVITDYQMPNRDGLDLCRQLRQIPELARIPVILLTAHGMNIDEGELRTAGVSVLMQKPFSPRELLARARELLDQARLVPAEETTDNP